MRIKLPDRIFCSKERKRPYPTTFRDSPQKAGRWSAALFTYLVCYVTHPNGIVGALKQVGPGRIRRSRHAAS